jgi:hypothetical protein
MYFLSNLMIENMTIKIITNRANNVFEEANKIFNEYIKENKLKPKKSTLVYLSRYNITNWINIFVVDKDSITNIKKHTIYISNKKTCSDLIRKYNFFEYYPVTYNYKNDIIDFNKNKLYFIKKSVATCSKGVICMKGEQLLKYKLKDDETIQEGITDIKLIDGKKFIIRAYIIIYNKKIYLSSYAYCAIFNKKYNKDESNHNIQVCYPHERYFIPLHNTEYSSYINNIKDSLLKIKKIFLPIINNSVNEFTIIGPDILITSDNKIKFIEFNHYPNLKHKPHINKEVGYKMIFDLLNLLFLDKKNDTLIEII